MQELANMEAVKNTDPHRSEIFAQYLAVVGKCCAQVVLGVRCAGKQRLGVCPKPL